MPTSHPNTVILISPFIDRVHPVDGSLSITSGQPSTWPPAVLQKGDSFEITLDCGRSASEQVANNFASAIGGPNHSWSCDANSIQPAELNFFFAVDVTFQLVTNPVRLYLAQGNVAHIINNWWIGGSPVILNTYPGQSEVAISYITPGNILLVNAPWSPSGLELVGNAFQFLPIS